MASKSQASSQSPKPQTSMKQLVSPPVPVMGAIKQCFTPSYSLVARTMPHRLPLQRTTATHGSFFYGNQSEKYFSATLAMASLPPTGQCKSLRSLAFTQASAKFRQPGISTTPHSWQQGKTPPPNRCDGLPPREIFLATTYQDDG